jgi:hypothetical protein
MNIFKLAWEILAIYLVYKFITGFIIPIYNTTRQMKGKMDEMQERMRQQAQDIQKQQAPPQAAPKRSLNEDYIDYEEVK